MTEKSLWLQKSVHSEFFWRKVKRFSEIHFSAKFWVFKLKNAFQNGGGAKKSEPPFFLLKKMAERRRKSSLHAATAALHLKGAAFSSLPRRNEMKPGHLHQTPEDLLVKTFRIRSTCEVAHFIRLWSFLLPGVSKNAANISKIFFIFPPAASGVRNG